MAPTDAVRGVAIAGALIAFTIHAAMAQDQPPDQSPPAQSPPAQPSSTTQPPPNETNMIGTPNAPARPGPAAPNANQATKPGSKRKAKKDETTESDQLTPFRITPRAGLQLTYTDNAFVTNTHPKADFVTSPSVGVNVVDDGAHTKIGVDMDAAYDFYNSFTQLNGARYNGIASVSSDVVPDYLNITGRAATSEEGISPFGAMPASPRSFGENQAQVLNYGIGPTLHARAGDYFTAQAAYNISFVDYYQAAASKTPITIGNSTIQSTNVVLNSGDYFTRFGWSLNGSLIHDEYPGAANDWRSGSGSLYYALYPNFRLVGTGGYDDIDTPSYPKPLGGLYLTGGFRLVLSKRTSISFDGGVRYRQPYFAATVSYSASSALVLHASYNDGVQSPQSLISAALNNIALSPTGVLINPATGLPAQPNAYPYGLTSNDVFRIHQFQAGVSGTLGRNSYAISGNYDRQTYAVAAGDGDSYYGSIMLGRQLTPYTKASLTTYYDRLSGYNFQIGLTEVTLREKAEVDYSLGKKTTLAIAYYYQRIHAFPVHTQENAATLALTRTF